MKTCPSCGLGYEDETLVFCLQDGARLVSSSADVNATLHIPPAAPTQPGPTVFNPPSASAQSTITGRPEQFHFRGRQTAAESAHEGSRRSPLPWILAIVAVIGISGILVAWLMTRDRPHQVAKHPSPTPGRSEITGDWQQCETTTGAGTFCGNWTFTNGQGTGQWGAWRLTSLLPSTAGM